MIPPRSLAPLLLLGATWSAPLSDPAGPADLSGPLAPTHEASTQDALARVDALFARWDTDDSPGCAVAVGRDGQTVLARAYGMAELEHGVPNTPETVFEGGSVSKQFTAAAVVLLAQRGRLSLDDPIHRYIPELPDYGEPITIRQMMNHTSGFRDWGTVVGLAGWPRGARAHTHAHVLDVVARQRALNYPPGEEYLYSNTNFNLQAILVERVSGESFAEFSRTNLFEPLGMTSTEWRDDFTRLVPGRAQAYRREADGWHLDMPFEDVHGNGGLLTTVGDLLRWNRNFADGTVGGRALGQEMETRGLLDDGDTIAYAEGLTVGEHAGIREVRHSGSTAGYRAYLTRFPEPGLSVAVLCNAADAGAASLADGTAEIFLPPHRHRLEPAAPPDAVQRRTLAAAAGLYRNVRTGEPVTLQRDGDGLRMDGTELVPLASGAFRLGEGGSRLTFETASGSSGGQRPDFVVHTRNGRVPYGPVEPWSPAPGELDAFTGTFHSDEAEVTYRVEARDGRLVLLRRPDWRQPLEPSWADAFTSASYLVRFVRDASGRVTELSLGAGRVRDLRLARVYEGDG